MSTQLEEFVRQTIDELLKELPPEKRMEGLTVEERLKGLSPEDVLSAMSPEEQRRTLEALQRRLGKNGHSHEQN